MAQSSQASNLRRGTVHLGQDISTSAVLDTLPTGVLLADTETRIIWANRKARSIFESQGGGLVGQMISSLLPESELGGAANHTARPEHTMPDGRVVGFQCTPLNDESGNNQLGWVVVCQDISKSIQVRQERDRLLQLAAVGSVLPTLLHELKNPLAAITARVELLVEEVEAGQVQNDLHAVLTEIRRMRLGFDGVGLIGQQLSSARPAAIDHCIREVCTVLSGRARNQGVALDISAIATMPLLPLDPSVMRAIVLNLVKNSLDACGQGNKISVRAHLRPESGDFILVVKDDGQGMTSEVLQHCLDLFYTTKPKGSGIGLALCKEAVQGVGGEFDIDSSPETGTTITLQIPLKTGTIQTLPHSTTQPRTENAESHTHS